MSDDFFDDFGWEDMALAGALAEEMAGDEKERLRLKRETAKEECECWCDDCDPSDPPPEDEPYEPPDEDPFP